MRNEDEVRMKVEARLNSDEDTRESGGGESDISQARAAGVFKGGPDRNNHDKITRIPRRVIARIV